MSVVIIEGLSYGTMLAPVQFRDELVLLQAIMSFGNYYDFQQHEAAATVETEETWFQAYEKEKYNEVTDFIDNVLPDLQMRQETCTHCSYAEDLKGLVEGSNPQEEEERKYDQPTEKTHKCQTVA
eukprot:2688081-Ditylum_brightwellii.AAC.1